MERAKLTNAKKTEPVNTRSARAPPKKTERKPKPEKLVCRYCGSDDLAPSFIKRRDRRCRKCFSKRYGSAARGKKATAKSSCTTIRSETAPETSRSLFSLLGCAPTPSVRYWP